MQKTDGVRIIVLPLRNKFRYDDKCQQWAVNSGQLAVICNTYNQISKRNAVTSFY